MQLANIQKMEVSHVQPFGMDVIIISTSTPQMEKYWVDRLNSTKEDLLKPEAMILVVREDWSGGAGNGLGSLYAFEQACRKAEAEYQVDLMKMLEDKSAIAIYHTAGNGRRLYPLTAAEGGNKSAIKLPGLMKNGKIITVLEAVIKQTSLFAPSRKGRLSVFWGDQIFIPSKSCDYLPKHHVDILAMVSPMPDPSEWSRRHLENYGLIILGEQEDGQVLDKCDLSTIQGLAATHHINLQNGIGVSLGSFSLSFSFLKDFLKEFSMELKTKKEIWDSDPFFWMPLTLDLETYSFVMKKKGFSKEVIASHHQRLHRFAGDFMQKYPQQRLFGVVNIGRETYWWDYGTVDSYFTQCLKLTQSDKEGEAMRQFFNVKPNRNENVLFLDHNSCLLGCQVRDGKIKNSVLVGVNANYLDIENTVIIHSDLKELQAKESLIYNVTDPQSLLFPLKSVRVDAGLPNEHQEIKLYSTFGRDGKNDWKIKLPPNGYSWEELHEKQLKSEADIDSRSLEKGDRFG